jgi:hypothetical protein
VSLHRSTLYGLTVYQLGRDFRPKRVIEVKSAVWRDGQWMAEGEARMVRFGPDGVREVKRAPANFTLPEALEDFSAVSVEPEELSYAMLRRQIRTCAARAWTRPRAGSTST